MGYCLQNCEQNACGEVKQIQPSLGGREIGTVGIASIMLLSVCHMRV
jgi:hypothetical protein